MVDPRRTPTAAEADGHLAPRPGAVGVRRDLHALDVLAAEIHLANTVVSQAAQALRDRDLMAACGWVEEHVRRQEAWLHTHILHRAPHTLTVPC